MFYSFRKAKAAHIKLGKRGEKLAVKYLRNIDCDILLTNYRNRYGEIDIIARDGREICFIEVKTRYYTTRSAPYEGFSPQQKLRVSRAAEAYLESLGTPDVVYRFDLIEIVIGRWDIQHLHHHRDIRIREKAPRE